MKKQVLIALGISGAVVLVLAIIKFVQISGAIADAEKQQMPPAAVTSYVAQEEEWPVTFSAIATIAPVEGATLSTEESGRVEIVTFESGAQVEKGQVLVELDSSVEQAQLDGASAELALAKLTAQRQETLRQKNANSQLDLDNAQLELKNAESEVKRLAAVIEKKKIVAPFAGRAGIRLVNIGQTVEVGAPVVTVNSFEKLYVNYNLPQQTLSDLSLGMSVDVKVDAYPDRKFEAKITAIESEVNADTRSISLQATLINTDELLRPGMFAEAMTAVAKVDKSIAVPASSVSYAPYGDTIYVIEAPAAGAEAGPRNIRAQTVKVGRRQGDRIFIVSGLKVGEEIVSSGTFKLRPGAQVVVNNSVTPENELNPKPADT